MRRLREAGIVTLLLLGLTGCAGVQQRLGGTEPPYLGDEGSEDRPLSRLAFWRRHRAEETVPAATAPGLTEPGRSNLLARNAASPSVADEERPGLLRRLPLVGRLWKNEDRGESDEIEMPAARFTPPVSTAASGFVPPRSPAAATARAAPRPRMRRPRPRRYRPRPRRPPRFSPAAPRRNRCASCRWSWSGPGRRLTRRRSRLEMPTRTRPRLSCAVPSLPRPPRVQRNRSRNSGPFRSPPVPSLGGEDAPPPTAVPGGQPDLTPVPSRAAIDAVHRDDEARVRFGVVVDAHGRLHARAGLVDVCTGHVLGSVQSMVMTSAQGSYVGGGCDEPCGGKCKLHKLCPFKKHKQRAWSYRITRPSSCRAPRAWFSSCGGRARSRSPASSRPGCTTSRPARSRVARGARPAPTAESRRRWSHRRARSSRPSSGERISLWCVSAVRDQIVTLGAPARSATILPR